MVGSTQEPSTCNAPSCSFTNNLCQSASQCGFTTAGAIVSTPAFVGGAPGGITSYGPGSTTNTPPAPPSERSTHPEN